MPAYEQAATLRDVAGHETLGAYLRGVWGRRSFAHAVIRAELAAQHQDSLLGRVWHLLNPVLFAAVYYLAFGIFLNAEAGVDNYLLFLLIGVFGFHLTQRSVMAGARTIEGNLELIQTVRFPRALLPTAAVLQETVGQAPAYALLCVVAVLSGVEADVIWLAIPLLMLLQSAFNLGCALAAARIAFHVRDVQIALPHVFRLWFYLSAVVYPLSFVDRYLGDGLFLAFRLNPAVAFIEALRAIILDGRISTFNWTVAASWTAFVLIAGFSFFRRFETRYGYG